MALSGYPFPYDIDNLLAGAVRIVYAPITQALPASMDDVFDPVAPYALKTGWKELGATRESFTYTRGFDTAGLEIQQSTAALFEEITAITRTIELSIAELTADTLKMIEGSQAAITTIAAATGSSAQKSIAFGAFSTLDRYRFAFISRRNKASGLVTEGAAGPTRGRFVMGVAYAAQMAADDSAIEQAKGALTAAGITYTLFPDDGVVSADANYGAWFFEDEGVIALV